MSLLPYHRNAIIPDEKIYDYCLNENHDRGKHKARVFKSTFGINVKDGELLKSAILNELSRSEITEVTENIYGRKYTLPMVISVFGITHEIITAWFIDFENKIPRLISCYVNI
jgi:hypothetical protein